MAKFKNVSSLGALEVPLLRRVIEADEEFEVPGNLAGHFEDQPANYEPVLTDAERKAAEKAQKKADDEAAAAKAAEEAARKAAEGGDSE